MGIVTGFLLGLFVGGLLLKWQQAKADSRLKALLENLKPDSQVTPFSVSSQLSLAITYQQKIQRQYEARIELYRQILNLSPLGFLQADDENRLVWCNPQARELLAITQNGTAPRLLLEIVRSYELDSLIDKTRREQQPRRRTWTFYPINADPSKVEQQQFYALRGHAIPLKEGHVGVFIENYQPMVTLQQQCDRWVSDVAHELKTPLTSIRLVAETLQMRLDPSIQGWAERLISQADRLSQIVQDLLELSRLEGELERCLRPTTVDVPELIQAAWVNLEPIASKKHVELSYKGPEQLLATLDEARFYRVVVNLLDNAIKYSPPWELVEVRLKADEALDSDAAASADSEASSPLDASEGEGAPALQLEIIDGGPGFKAEDLPHIFERFYRADASRSRQPVVPGASTMAYSVGGSGLGLAIVKQIVAAHHGTVWAENHPERGGGWIQVIMPR
ncbi:MAG: PAS domain-containing sensor histidine kinase [Cyanobacteria bacterium P01_A01_bin.135]